MTSITHIQFFSLTVSENGKVQGGGARDQNKSLFERGSDVGDQVGPAGEGTPRDFSGVYTTANCPFLADFHDDDRADWNYGRLYFCVHHF